MGTRAADDSFEGGLRSRGAARRLPGGRLEGPRCGDADGPRLVARLAASAVRHVPEDL